ncbi:MAG TPA: glutathione binding-like protein [Polyangiaceae bacterium]|nr:glutathione binding-like protein [Polyangiaceae bacterium]
MKLYYSPFACSLAAHVACREAGLNVELVRVELPTKRTESGTDLFAENPMGQVPTLILDDGRILTENVAVLFYLAERAAGTKVSPAPRDTYELVRWLAFVSTELHKKVLAPIYNPCPDAVKDFARTCGDRAFAFLNTRLESRDTLLGEEFTAADAYCFWALMLMPHSGISLESYPALQAYHERHRKRPTVREVLRYEKAQWDKPFAAAPVLIQTASA